MASTRNWTELLNGKMAEGKSVCVGLDTDVSKLGNRWQVGFNRDVIDATIGIAQSYKFQVSMYEHMWAVRGFGLQALKDSVSYIHKLDPTIPVILDFKRGDIGNSNNGYVELAFERLGVDAVTVNPYMGRVEGIQSFLDVPNKGIIVLCRTSNKGGMEIQDLSTCPLTDIDTGILYSCEDHARVEGLELRENQLQRGFLDLPLYEYVAHRVAKVWNQFAADCAVVVGARPDHMEELARIRKIVVDMPILIPGLGAQGGNDELTIKYGRDSKGMGMIINNSRGIIFAEDPGQAAADFHARIQQLQLAYAA
jgi:orotidine-5'-phosphate decarboxylase